MDSAVVAVAGSTARVSTALLMSPSVASSAAFAGPTPASTRALVATMPSAEYPIFMVPPPLW
ncbi:hypothetical protein DZF92_03145 [Clavibacter michiganensis subsp. insidiosus]|nr:hypothetical protein DZF92_03145 [Clavibacter michiganensis subsp. insidiosus]